MSDKQIKQRLYSQKHRATKGRPPSFKLEYSGDDSVKAEIQEKVSKVKSLISADARNVSNTDVIRVLLDHCIQQHQPPAGAASDEAIQRNDTGIFVSVGRSEIDQPVFLSALSCIEHLINRAVDVTHSCRRPKWTAKEKYRRGHAISCDFHCEASLPSWTSSPSLPGGKFLVNMRVAHGYHVSGMLFNQYQHFAESANIGVISDHYMKEINTNFLTAVQEEYQGNIQQALREEVGMSILAK